MLGGVGQLGLGAVPPAGDRGGRADPGLRRPGHQDLRGHHPAGVGGRRLPRPGVLRLRHPVQRDLRGLTAGRGVPAAGVRDELAGAAGHQLRLPGHRPRLRAVGPARPGRRSGPGAPPGQQLGLGLVRLERAALEPQLLEEPPGLDRPRGPGRCPAAP